MKIRIFALAKELGLDSKELIEIAGTAGVEVKNSALASISPEERDLVMAQLHKVRGTAGPSGSSAPAAPRRDVVPDRGPARIRQIEAPAVRPARSARPAESQESDSDYAPAPVAAEADDRIGDTAEEREEDARSATGTAVAEPPAENAAAEEATAQEAPAEDVPAVSATEASSAGTVEASPPATKPVSSQSVAPIAPVKAPEVAASPAAPPKAEPPAHPPVSRPAPAGASPPPATPVRPAAAQESREPKERSGAPVRPTPLRPEGAPPRRIGGGIRDMRPVGNMPSNTQRGGAAKDAAADKDKKRPMVARPSVAPPPTFTPSRPKPNPNEGPAQKPDMPLTPGMLKHGQSPLSAQVASQKSGQKPPGPGRPRPGMSGRELTAEEKEQEALRARRQIRPGRRRREDGSDDDGGRRRQLHRNRSRRQQIQYADDAVVEFPITVRSLSEAMGRPAKQLLGVLFKSGKMVTINDLLDEEAALDVALELGVELTLKRERDLEAELEDLMAPDDDESLLVARPPIVTILGHVDHGKTTLIDKIRAANVAAGEAGGITQHIAAYQVEHNGQKITFVDTPGHAAFGEMRARGANVTDVVVLVVAADDGVMPQTEESISHARAAGVPMIVALNKIDLPGIDQNKALQSLAARNVLPAEWGGDTEVVRTSGMTGKGVDDLLDTILITAELNQYKANPDRPAVGVCLEAFRDEGLGPLAWVVVENGTLAVGDIILCGSAYGRVRAMYDDRNNEIEEAGPSTPVKVAGLESVPNSGSHFFVMESIEDARDLAEERARTGRAEFLASTVRRPQTLDDILATAQGGEVAELPLILKADTPGSIEAIRNELSKFEHPEVRVRLIHAAVGGVNESDVSLASASGAVIVAFHVVPEDRAAAMADREGVEIRRYSIIYEVLDSIRDRLEGMLKPERREVPTGRAIVLQTFKISRMGTIAGCRVLGGTIGRNDRVHLVRQQTVVNTYSIGSLRREKEDVREVREGMECGIRLENFNDIKEGDMLEAFRIEEVKRTFD